MHVVRHHYGDMQMVFGSMIMTATPKNNIASPIRQNPTILCNKGDEVRFIVALKMRKDAPMKAHGKSLFHEGVGILAINLTEILSASQSGNHHKSRGGGCPHLPS